MIRGIRKTPEEFTEPFIIIISRDSCQKQEIYKKYSITAKKTQRKTHGSSVADFHNDMAEL